MASPTCSARFRTRTCPMWIPCCRSGCIVPITRASRSPRRCTFPTSTRPAPRRSIQAGDDRQALDPAALIGAQKGRVILEDHAAVGFAARAEPLGVREQAGAAEGIDAADRIEAQRLDAMEQLLDRRQFV